MSFMNNMQFSAKVIQKLLDIGVEEFCLCAGARNSSLIKTFSENTQIKVFHFFEERSAAFFALGRIMATRKPVAVVTTSGTAVSELLSGVVEAFYQGLPLVLLTADRPKSYRMTGAPQTIEQSGIFSQYVESCVDIDIHSQDWSLASYSFRKPLHVNVCFDEPLLDSEVVKLETAQKAVQTIVARLTSNEFSSQVLNFLKDKKPLVIVSGLSVVDQEPVLKFLEKQNGPLFIETTSGLRNHKKLLNKQLMVAEKSAKKLLMTGECDAIVRLGGIPTTRLWRDLEFQFKNIPVLSVTNTSFSGLSRLSTLVQPLSALLELPAIEVANKQPVGRSYDQTQFEKLNALIEKYPKSEPAMVRKLSVLTDKQPLYLGNSMPIREWDLAISAGVENSSVLANRGANGIDGQVSTFLGTCQQDINNWALIGDLTALYDLPSLWIGKQILPENIFLVVLNNSGGMIFNRIFKSEYFLNRHEIEFSHWAQMWSWKYEKWSDIPLKNNLSGRTIIELVPDEQQTQLFWEEWDKDDRN